ncbi:glucosylceramide transporter ABCA12-like [Haemaphysalis longicornis]
MESDDAEEERVQSRCALWIQQLHVLLWKDIYLKRICRHYPSLLIEITLMIVLLLGIQEETVVREPLILRGDTIYPPVHPSLFWNTNPALANIREVYYFAEDNSYLHKLTVEAFADLGVSNVVSLSSEAQLIAIARDVVRQTMPVRTVVLRYSSTSDTAPESLHVSFFAGPLPFDVQLHYQRRLIASPEGPAREEMYPEVNTLLPIVAALQQRHLQLQAGRFNYNHPLHPVTLRRFPYPDHIEYHDTKNYAFVLTRFCVGMLIPFSMFAAHLAEEKATGIKEMQRLVGLSDWVYWASHYLAGLAIHTCISAMMMLFVSIIRNEQGRAFIEYSDPALLLWILMCFCSSCIMHATLLSMFFSTSASAVAGAMVYWTLCCLLPFLALEHADGQGYHYIQRKHKLWTAIFPGMNLHWSFRILERFEKFVDHGANWNNFFDSAATPDNVTLGEMILLGISTEWAIMFLVWYIDNVFPTGPTLAKSFFYFLKD